MSPRHLLAFAAAVLGTALLFTLVQTQFNLARIGALGVEITFAQRIAVTARDVWGFGPQCALLVGAAFLVAFPVTGLIRRRLARARTALYALAGAVAIGALLVLMEMALGLTAIAATRSAGGSAAFALCGAAGGWLFATFSAQRA